MSTYEERQAMPPEEITRRRAFLLDILKACQQHGYSISHEDDHGAFQVKPFEEYLMVWLLKADYSLYWGAGEEDGQ